MSWERKNGFLEAQGFRLADLITKYGSPLYVYNGQKIRSQVTRLQKALEAQKLNYKIHYSVKANSSLGILSLLKNLGLSFDIVSGGELLRCQKVGAQASDIVFSGVGKSDEEIELGLKSEILQFNVESSSELERISKLAAQLGKVANVALRINPDIDALTHEYITTGTYDSKFGVSINEAMNLYQRFRDDKNLKWVGLDMHIGSQLTEEKPILRALRRFAGLAKALKSEGFPLVHLDIGGGLGIRYSDEKVISPERFAEMIAEGLSDLNIQDYKLILEPGRFIVAESGILLTQILHVKDLASKVFYIVDAGMTELMRPSLYGAYHEVVPLEESGQPCILVDIVGPICESSDSLAKKRLLPRLEKGQSLGILNSGAYAASMGNNYNTRAKPAELLLDQGKEHLIRKAQVFEDLVREESALEFKV